MIIIDLNIFEEFIICSDAQILKHFTISRIVS